LLWMSLVVELGRDLPVQDLVGEARYAWGKWRKAEVMYD
jgi:hypothetical protein